MKTSNYKQCELETDDGKTHYQCWLPTRYARRGMKVRITDYPHTLWNIVSVFPRTIDEELLQNLGESHRYHRKVTDI